MKTLDPPSFSIGEAADRSGFPAATLRYYDELGLVRPAQRAANGYRRYVDADLERLRFVGRAKHLGCSLEEISSLLVAYDGGECGPIQEQLRSLVDTKIAESQRQMVELTMLVAELQRSLADLGRHRAKGACNEQCGCISQPTGETVNQPISEASNDDEGNRLGRNIVGGLTIGRAPGGVIFTGSAEIACTLKSSAMPERLSAFQTMFVNVCRRVTLEGGVRLEFDQSIDLSALASLLAAEQQCCAFWAFAITIDKRGVAMEVRGPEGTAAMIDALFGVAAA
jgi:MerR family transcriptional regulator, copper efflux regulator